MLGFIGYNPSHASSWGMCIVGFLNFVMIPALVRIFIRSEKFLVHRSNLISRRRGFSKSVALSKLQCPKHKGRSYNIDFLTCVSNFYAFYCAERYNETYVTKNILRSPSNDTMLIMILQTLLTYGAFQASKRKRELSSVNSIFLIWLCIYRN